MSLEDTVFDGDLLNPLQLRLYLLGVLTEVHARLQSLLHQVVLQVGLDVNCRGGGGGGN